jgi:hypothetical protein
MRAWMECCTRFKEIIWAMRRLSAYALMPEPYCRGPEKPCGNGARVWVAQCGQDLTSASTWLSTFSKTMSIWVRRSWPSGRRARRSSPHCSQKLTLESTTVSTVRVLAARLGS